MNHHWPDQVPSSRNSKCSWAFLRTLLSSSGYRWSKFWWLKAWKSHTKIASFFCFPVVTIKATYFLMILMDNICSTILEETSGLNLGMQPPKKFRSNKVPATCKLSPKKIDDWKLVTKTPTWFWQKFSSDPLNPPFVYSFNFLFPKGFFVFFWEALKNPGPIFRPPTGKER